MVCFESGWIRKRGRAFIIRAILHSGHQQNIKALHLYSRGGREYITGWLCLLVIRRQWQWSTPGHPHLHTALHSIWWQFTKCQNTDFFYFYLFIFLRPKNKTRLWRFHFFCTMCLMREEQCLISAINMPVMFQLFMCRPHPTWRFHFNIRDISLTWKQWEKSILPCWFLLI